MAETSSTRQTGDEPIEEYKLIDTARVLWPADLSDDLLSFIISTSLSAIREFNPEREGAKVAERIKKSLDSQHGPHWHVILGTSFGSHAVHEKNRFTYFYLGNFAFLIYKAGSG